MSPLTYVLTLASTLALELPIAAALAPPGARRRVVAAAAWTNLLSHPFATLAVTRAGWPLLPVEVGVVAVEWLAYRVAVPLSWRRALAVSALCNAVTTGVALLLR